VLRQGWGLSGALPNPQKRGSHSRFIALMTSLPGCQAQLDGSGQRDQERGEAVDTAEQAHGNNRGNSAGARRGQPVGPAPVGAETPFRCRRCYQKAVWGVGGVGTFSLMGGRSGLVGDPVCRSPERYIPVSMPGRVSTTQWTAAA